MFLKGKFDECSKTNKITSFIVTNISNFKISFFVGCLISVILNESRRLKRRKIWPDVENLSDTLCIWFFSNLSEIFDKIDIFAEMPRIPTILFRISLKQ
jgi:hypothetical protein